MSRRARAERVRDSTGDADDWLRSCDRRGGTGKRGNESRGRDAPSMNYPGSDLLSHAVTSAVPSALEGLTSVFGMGTGVAPPASPPGMGTQSNTLILECRQAMHCDWKNRGQAARPISTAKLNASQRLHL